MTKILIAGCGMKRAGGIGMEMFVVAAWRDENIGGMRGLKSLFRTLLTEPRLVTYYAIIIEISNHSFFLLSI